MLGGNIYEKDKKDIKKSYSLIPADLIRQSSFRGLKKITITAKL